MLTTSCSLLVLMVFLWINFDVDKQQPSPLTLTRGREDCLGWKVSEAGENEAGKVFN
jgi:hypothetical protein